MPHQSLPTKKTKIVCTIGPASQAQEVLETLIDNGMNIARLNFAHGDFESHARTIANIRAAVKRSGRRVAIMGDLPGPKMRIGRLAQEPITLERGDSFILQAEKIEGNEQRVTVSFPGIYEVAQAGDQIFINDGFIELEVEYVSAGEIHCRVLAGGQLRSHKGVNFPGIDLGISAFTENDRAFLEFAAAQNLDAVSQSFVQDARDIQAVRQAAADLGYHPFIIAKIERSRAFDTIDAILQAADGIMVARGDLGVEIPIETIAIAQKHIIKRANLHSKPAITATQLLESMVDNRRPTRAESTDVANAILDGTDCVMLSEETAMGHYPAEAVAMMSRIAEATEPYVAIEDIGKLLEEAKTLDAISKDDLISLSVYATVKAMDAAAVMVPTVYGGTPRRLSRFRLPVWIIAVSPNEWTLQTLQFSYGTHPLHENVRPASWEQYAQDLLAALGIGEGLAILAQGSNSIDHDATNRIDIIDLSLAGPESSEW